MEGTLATYSEMPVTDGPMPNTMHTAVKNSDLGTTIKPVSEPQQEHVKRKRKDVREMKLISIAKRHRRQLGNLISRCMREKIEHLQNPRYCRVRKAVKALQLLIRKEKNEEYVPLSDPPSIIFNGYDVGSTNSAQLKVLNVSTWSQRIRIMQPASPYFHVIVMESFHQGTVLAPGETCKFMITFSTDSGVNVEDIVTVTCEMCAIRLHLAARNPFPWVEIPSTINLGPCLIGHHTTFLLSLTSKGAASTFQVLSSDEMATCEISEQKSALASLYNVLLLPQFVVYPSHFRLKKDECGEIVIVFMPQCAGNYEVKLKLITDGGLDWSIFVTGCGIDFHVTVEKIDEEELKSNDGQLDLWFGCATVSSINACRSLVVKNQMQIPVRYFWMLEDDCDLSEPKLKAPYNDSKTVFFPTPSFGILDAEMDKQFTFHFVPKKPILYNQCASLYIDTKRAFPLQSASWKQLNVILQDLLAMTRVNDSIQDDVTAWDRTSDNGESEKEDILLSSLKGSDNVGCVRKILNLKLSGTGEPLQVQLMPPVLCLSDLIEQGQTLTTTVLLRNNNSVNISFSWQVPDVCWESTKDLNHVSVFPLSGNVKPMDTIELCLDIKARKIGRFIEKLFCQVMGGPKLVFQVEGCVQGPLVKMSPVLLDFGVAQVGKESSLELKLTNMSSVSTCFKFLPASKLPVTSVKLAKLSVLASVLDINTLGDVEEMCLSSSGNAPKSEGKGRNALVEQRSNNIQQGQEQILFDPFEGTLCAKAQISVKVVFRPLVCGRLRWAIQCEIAGGLSCTQYAIVHTQASASAVCLSPSTMDLGIVYLGSSLQETVLVQNLCALESQFKWSKYVNEGLGSLVIDIQPESGVLQPHGQHEVKVNLTPRETGEITCTIVCRVSGMMNPSELNIRLYVSDMFCSFHVERSLSLIDHSSKIRFLKRELSNLKTIDNSKVPPLNFGKRLLLGTVYSLSLVVKNRTAVPGIVRISVGKYGLEHLLTRQQIADLIGKSSLGTTSMSQNTSLLDDLGKSCRNKFHYASGHAMVFQRLWASSCMVSRKGLAVITSACEKKLKAWEMWECQVFCYGLIPGSYNDVIYCTAGNNLAVEIPLSIGLIGTPLSLTQSQFEPREFGQTGQVSCIMLKWSAAAAGHPPREKSFYVMNAASVDLELDWEKMNTIKSAEEASVEVIFNVDSEVMVHLTLLGDPDKGPVEVHLQVEEAITVQVILKENLVPCSSMPPFQIEPQKQCIPARSSVSFTVKHHSEIAGPFSLTLVGKTRVLDAHYPHDTIPDVLSTCEGKPFSIRADESVCTNKQEDVTQELLEERNHLSLAHMINKQAANIIDISPLYVGLEALSFVPRLNICPEDTLSFTFIPTTCHLSTCTLLLTNEYSHNLSLRIISTPPFYLAKILERSCLERTTDSDMDNANFESNADIVLPPASPLKVEIHFKPPEEQLADCKDLNFESDLLIAFSNKFEQKVPMVGAVYFPELVGYSKSIWFGNVLLKSSQTIPFTLTNVSQVDAHWCLIQDLGIDENASGSLTMEMVDDNKDSAANLPDGRVGKGIVHDSGFIFDCCNGMIQGACQSTINRQTVSITFSPREPKFYSLKVFVKVTQGRGFHVVLEGQGVAEIPNDSPPLPEPQKRKPTKKAAK